MKESSTSQRLREIMEENGLRQVDVLELVKPYCEKYGVTMNKSNLSQYCSGANEPLQDKLFVLSLALGVSEGWLMGYDVPRERKADAERFQDFAEDFNAKHPYLPSIDEKELLNNYRKLLPEGKKKLRLYASSLLSVQEAEQDLQAAHERTDIPTGADAEAARRHDLDIMDDF